MTTGFTDTRVRDWTAAAPHRWLRWVLAAAWVAAIATSIATDTTSCTTEDLTVCGPDPVFSVAMVFCLGAIALLWWRPLVAVACAVIFAGLDVVFDEAAAAKISWVLVALLFVGYAVHLRRGVEQQRRIAREAQVHLPLFSPPAPERFRLDGPHQAMAAAAVGLVLVAAGSVYGYTRAVGLDAEHLDRSHVVEGVVRSEPNDDLAQRVELTRRPEGVPASIDVEFLNTLPIGTDVVVRVDPEDLTWSHSVAEPPDRTWWFTVGLGGLLVAGLLAERVLRVRVQRRRLAAVRHEVGVPVRVFTDDLDFVGLVATDSARGLAEFPVDEALSLDRPEDRRVAPPSAAYLVGDVCAGGWAAVLSPSGLQLPMGPLAALPPDTEVDLDSFDKDPDRSWDERWSDGWEDEAKGPPEHWSRPPETSVGRVARSGRELLGLLWSALGVAAGLFILYFGLTLLLPGWSVARGDGVRGSLTVTVESCGKSCDYFGTYRSDDGRYVFEDVGIIGAGDEVGDVLPAIYVGDGEAPSEVYSPGWSGVVEGGFMTVVGGGLALVSAGALLEPILARHATGRHASRSAHRPDAS